MKKTYCFLSVIFVFALTASCTSYTTNLNTMEKIKMSGIANVKKGMACSKNLFGGFSLPYFGDTAIKMSGDESVIAAIKSVNITHVYAVDRNVRNYIFYSKRCTIVFGN